MTWRVRWTGPAERSLGKLPFRDAQLVDAAVQRYAATGEGFAYRLPDDGPTTARLRVGSYRVWLILDLPERASENPSSAKFQLTGRHCSHLDSRSTPRARATGRVACTSAA
jgi:mRNA-degrading endonuclease RelE of RelBE toxin-antitoxin system